MSERIVLEAAFKKYLQNVALKDVYENSELYGKLQKAFMGGATFLIFLLHKEKKMDTLTINRVHRHMDLFLDELIYFWTTECMKENLDASKKKRKP